MPRSQINYENTIFYKLVCKDVSLTECDVGHTTDFRRRKNEHKRHCEYETLKTCKLYAFIREHGGFENFDMVMITRESCTDALDAKRKERAYIEQFRAELNCVVPSRSDQEYKVANKERIQEQAKEWWARNRERISEQRKEWRQSNAETVKERGRLYYERNKQHILEKHKLRRMQQAAGVEV